MNGSGFLVLWVDAGVDLREVELSRYDLVVRERWRRFSRWQAVQAAKGPRLRRLAGLVPWIRGPKGGLERVRA